MNKIRVRNIASAFVVTLLLGASILTAQEAPEKAAGTTEPGDTIYTVGNGVKSPKGTYMPDPTYADKPRKKKIQGMVTLSVVVSAEGNVSDAKVIKSLDKDLDQQAVATVSTWKFEPGTKDGKPVAVRVKIEVEFKLYNGGA